MRKTSHILPENLLQQLSDFISDKMGIAHTQESWIELENKLTPLSEELGFDNLETCVRWMMGTKLDTHLINLLADHLTIGETYFFRDSALFTMLQELILPSLIYEKEKTQKSLRIWCAACSTGEEPYSIAILLRQLIFNLNEWDILILGTDINPFFLQKAKLGQYKEWSFRATPQVIKNQYFQKRGPVYFLNENIKKMVTFRPLNLVSELYPSIVNNTNEMDLIICNNVFIYFQHKQIQKVTHKLFQALVNKGWLVVSAVEIPFIHHDHLKPILYKQATAFQKDSILTPKITSKQIESTQSFVFSQPVKEIPYSNLLELYQQGEYQKVIAQVEPLFINEQIIEQEKNILLIKSYANLGKFDKARQLCERCLKQDKLNPFYQFLHAELLQDVYQIPQAIEALKKALYLDPNFALASFSLGNLMLAEGNTNEAKRCFRNALKALEAHHFDEILPGSEEVSVQRLADLIKEIMR